MAYCVDIYKFPESIEYEFKWEGKYGAKGERREKKIKPTPEQVKKQNQWKKEKYAKRVMKLNFVKGDLWCTFLYPKGTRKSIEDVKVDIKKFLRKLRDTYKKMKAELKFMYRIEIGSRGGIHMHMICNHIKGEPAIDMIIQDAWVEGRVSFERFKAEEEDYKKLGEYLVKIPNEEQKEKINERKDTVKDKKSLIAYSSSRNLIRPVPERKRYKRKTVRKILLNKLEPTKGYYIQKDSIISGVNPFTGMSYLYYTEVKIKKKPK
jgi:hypothetical protein|nr:MAG TPA: protein of unknown function DUF1424 [Caudoviricetes sp.]